MKLKHIAFLLCIAALAGCSTPNPNPGATLAVYNQVKCGMSRQEVFALLGSPLKFQPGGNVEHCQSATWSIPHNSHGVGHCTIYFAGDTVASVENAQAMITFEWRDSVQLP